jgi:uncharacterized membrane protein
MNLPTTQRAVGVFPTHKAAEDALDELRSAWFEMRQISIIAKHTDGLDHSTRIGETNVQDISDANQAEEGAATGAKTGGVVGGLTGLLVGLGTLAIPGIGPVMLAGAAATALATTVTGGAIGAAAGSLLGALIGLGIPEDKAHKYNDSIARGEYLVVVDGTSTEILQAEAILKRRGIRDWEVYPASLSKEAVEHNAVR